MMSNANDWFLLIGKITTALMLIPILIAILKWSKLNKPMKVFFIFCVASFLLNAFEISFVWLATHNNSFTLALVKKFNIENTNFLHILYDLKNYLLLGWFYTLVFKPYKFSDLFKPLAIIFTAISLISYFFIDGHDVASGINYVASSLFCWLPPMGLMWFIFHEDAKVPISKNPYFWLGLSLIVASLPSFLLSFIGQKIYETDYALFITVSTIKNIFTVLAIIMRSLGFWNVRYNRFLPQ